MTLLLQIQQPDRLPLFVRSIRRGGGLLVTFERSRARRFRSPQASYLVQVHQAVCLWPVAGAVAYVPAGL